MDRHRSLYKATTPPWKEAYRQRCVDRLKNSRVRLLDRYRQMGLCREQNCTMVQEVMEEEWSALRAQDRGLPSLWGPKDEAELQTLMQEDLAVLEEIQQELVSQENSIIEEFEKNLQFEEQCISEAVRGMEVLQIICPLCHMNNLSISSCFISCPCGLYINTTKRDITPDHMQHLLESRVSEHMEDCPYNPIFSVTACAEGSPSLMLSCQVCDYLSVVL